MKDSWWQDYARPGTVGNRCKGFSFTRASAYIVSGGLEKLHTPKPNKASGTFVDSNNPLYAADLGLTTSEAKDFSYPKSSISERTMGTFWNCCYGEADTIVRIDGKVQKPY